VHVLLEGVMSRVLDGLHADSESGVDVFGLVVDEEDVGGWGVEAFGCVEVDGGLGLRKIHGVGPGVVVEGFDPVVAGAKACLHGVGHVGQDASADAGALQALDPLEHGWVELAPEIGVGVDEPAELCGSEDDACAGGGFVPEGFGVEFAAVVGVAVGPVSAVENVFAEARYGAHASPGGWVGWAGEDHAVVEENCLNRSHGSVSIVRDWGVGEFPVRVAGECRVEVN